MKTFHVLKKNRKYFEAVLNGTYKCKILIDEASRDLPLGQHELEVEDISVRSKYGTDLIFKLKASLEDVQAAGLCTLRHFRYNEHLHHRCKRLGGTWDADEQAWIFSGMVADEVDALDELYNSPLLTYELTYTEDDEGECESVRFCGYTIAKAYGRDSGATLAEGVALIQGSVGSGGSMKNWRTVIYKGAVIRMRLPQQVVEQFAHQHEGVQYRVLDQ